jgi:recombinational DNA repair protein (RecF pathway)
MTLAFTSPRRFDRRTEDAMSLDRIITLLMLAGTAIYLAYRIEKTREDIRKTIQVIELSEVDFWQELTELRGLAQARA